MVRRCGVLARVTFIPYNKGRTQCAAEMPVRRLKYETNTVELLSDEAKESLE